MKGKTSIATPPENWPSNIEYLNTSCTPSEGLSTLHRSIFCQPALDPESPSSVSSLLKARNATRIQKTNEPSHPAYGQYGLFARVQIPARTVVIPYFGLVHTEAESDESSDYDLRVWGPLDADAQTEGQESTGGLVPLGIDATLCGNEARFVNDYRGIAQRPNVFFEEYETPAQLDQPLASSRRGLLFKTGAQPVKAGTELVVSYGKGFWKARQTGQETSGEGHHQQQDHTQERSPAPTPATKTPPGSAHIQAMLERQKARLRGQHT